MNKKDFNYLNDSFLINELFSFEKSVSSFSIELIKITYIKKKKKIIFYKIFLFFIKL